MSSAASAPVSAPSGPSLTRRCSSLSCSTAWSSGSCADQRRRDVARDDAERGEAALHRRGLADAGQAVIGLDAHEGAARVGGSSGAQRT